MKYWYWIWCRVTIVSMYVGKIPYEIYDNILKVCIDLPFSYNSIKKWLSKRIQFHAFFQIYVIRNLTLKRKQYVQILLNEYALVQKKKKETKTDSRLFSYSEYFDHLELLPVLISYVLFTWKWSLNLRYPDSALWQLKSACTFVQADLSCHRANVSEGTLYLQCNPGNWQVKLWQHIVCHRQIKYCSKKIYEKNSCSHIAVLTVINVTGKYCLFSHCSENLLLMGKKVCMIDCHKMLVRNIFQCV